MSNKSNETWVPLSRGIVKPTFFSKHQEYVDYRLGKVHM
jgi:hypothetical protein